MIFLLANAARQQWFVGWRLRLARLSSNVTYAGCPRVELSNKDKRAGAVYVHVSYKTIDCLNFFL